MVTASHKCTDVAHGVLVVQAEGHVRDQLAALHAEVAALKDSRQRYAEQQKEQVSPWPAEYHLLRNKFHQSIPVAL